MAIQEATPIVLTADERTTLEGWVRSGVIEHRLVERARVVLLAAAGLAIIAAQVIIVLGVLRGIVGIQTYVPDLLLAGILLLFGVVSVALGMLIAAFAPSFGVATGLSTLIISPSCMLAGCFWSISMMPPVMQKLALFMPQRWVLDGLASLQEGGGRLGIDMLVLAAFAVTFFLVAIYGFKRREDAGQFV